jgi:hypothetical protein
MQTLSPLIAVSSPVVITDSNTLLGDMSALDNLGRSQIKTVGIIGMIRALAQIGSDYTADHAQLIQDATTFMGGISLVDDNGATKTVLILQAVLAWGAGYAADATTPTDVNDLLAEGRDLIALPEETLNRIYFFLFYVLSV